VKTGLLLRPSLPALALVAVLLAACRSSQPGSASFASVVIPNRTAEEIGQTTRQVFQEAGYQSFAGATGDMMFEKEGTHGNALAHGGIYATQQGSQTWVRVKASVVSLGAGSHRLQCHAFMVPHHGDAFFEEEHALTNFRSGPYQRLLDEVLRRLK